MSVIIDPNWVANTVNDTKSVPLDQTYVKLLSPETMTAGTVAVAKYILSNVIDADEFLQEFVNRALTDIGFNLTIIKGLHQAADSHPFMPLRHFDVQATGKKPANPGTHGLIYHIYVLTGTTVKKGGTVLLNEIRYKEGGNVTTRKLGDIPQAVKN